MSDMWPERVPQLTKPTVMHTLFPELNANQLKQLHRLLSDKLYLTSRQIGHLDKLFAGESHESE